MAVTATPIYPQTLITAAVNITSALAGSAQTVLTAGTNGTKVEWISILTTDTAANIITFNLYNGTTQFPLTVVSVPAGSGNTATVVPFQVFVSTQLPFLTYDSNGNKYLYLAPSWSLTATTTAVSSAKTVTISVQAENF